MNGRWLGGVALALASSLVSCVGWPGGRPAAPGERSELEFEVPADPAAEAAFRFMAGRVSEAESELAEAAQQYERVLVLDPAALEAHRRLLDVYARSGNPQRALEHARPLLAAGEAEHDAELRSKVGALFEWIARDLIEHGDLQAAVTVLREKLSLFPGDLAALEGILRLQGQAGLDVIPALEERARFHPENHVARFELGYAYFQLERYADAIRELEPVLQSGSQDKDPALAPLLSRVRFLLGKAHTELGETDAALKALRGVASGDPLADEARAEEARLLEAAGRRSEAIAVLRRAVKDREFSDLHIALVELLQRAKQRDQAIALLRRSIQADAQSGRARVVLAGILRDADKPEQAAEVLRAVERGDPAFFEARLGLIQYYESSGKLPEAIAELETIGHEQPDSLQLQVYLASLKRRAGDLAGATALLESVLQSAGGSPQADRARYALGRFYQEAGDGDKALAVLGEIDESSAVRSDARLVLAQLYEERKDYPRAIAELEALIQERPDAIELQIYLAGLQERSGDVPAALERMEKLAASSTGSGGEDHGRMLYVLGRLYAEADRPGDAERTLRSVPKSDPLYADAQLALVQLLEKQERTGEALRAMQGAVELRPEAVDLRVYLAELTQRTGDLPKAIAMMNALIAHNPDRAVDLHYRLGVIYGAAGQEERALEIMQKALEGEGRDDARILNYVGYSWAERGERLPEAERLIRRAAEIDPDDGAIADSLGWVLYRRAKELRAGGDDAQVRELLEASLVELERAAQLVPDDPTILHHVGDVYRSLERFEQALDTYRSALRVQKDQAKAQEIQSEIEALEAQLRGDRSGYAR